MLIDRWLTAEGLRETEPLDPHKNPEVKAMQAAEQQRQREDDDEERGEGRGERVLDQAEELGEEGGVELSEDEGQSPRQHALQAGQFDAQGQDAQHPASGSRDGGYGTQVCCFDNLSQDAISQSSAWLKVSKAAHSHQKSFNAVNVGASLLAEPTVCGAAVRFICSVDPKCTRQQPIHVRLRMPSGM